MIGVPYPAEQIAKVVNPKSANGETGRRWVELHARLLALPP